jgi:hypothetical protein
LVSTITGCGAGSLPSGGSRGNGGSSVSLSMARVRLYSYDTFLEFVVLCICVYRVHVAQQAVVQLHVELEDVVQLAVVEEVRYEYCIFVGLNSHSKDTNKMLCICSILSWGIRMRRWR